MAEKRECPRCGSTCTLEIGQDPLIIDYDYDDWRKRCQYPSVDALTSCPGMLPTLRPFLPRPPEPKPDGKC